jgi:hypothetical protein
MRWHSRPDEAAFIHQYVLRIVPLILIDQGYQPLEMLACTMRIEGLTVWPLFDKNKMARIFFIDKQVVRDALGFFFRRRDQLTIQRHNGIDMLGFDEIFGNDF